MTENLKKGDFIEFDYTARLQEDGRVFDTTSKAVADEQHIHIHKAFEPMIACVGEGHVLPGLDNRFEGAQLGKHTFELPAVEAFGKKNTKLLQLIPRKVFMQQNIQPMVGLEVNVDNQQGIIRSISGGRVIVDFNHPLASKDLVYEVDIKRVVTDQALQVKAMLKLLRIPFETVEVVDDKALVKGAQQLPPQLVEIFAKDIVRLTGIKDLSFGQAPQVQEKKSSNQNTEDEKKQ